MRSVIEILALQAVAHQMCGNPAAALATLERALILAEPEDFVRMFIDLGEPIEKLLRQWTETRSREAADLPHPIAPYVYRLITVFAQVENATAATRKEPRSEQNPGRLPESLTALSRRTRGSAFNCLWKIQPGNCPRTGGCYEYRQKTYQ